MQDEITKLCQQAAQLQEQKRWEQADALVEQAVQADPKSATAWFTKGNGLDWRDREEAIPALQRCTELAPEWALPWFHKGLAEQKHGRNREAIASYRRFLDLPPDGRSDGQRQHAQEQLRVLSETWVERLAHGDDKDAQAFVGVAKPRSRGWIQPLLFVLSLPVLIPSLLFMFLTAKRWGRIDFFMIFFNAFVVLFLSMGSYVYFPLSLVSIAALSILAVMRADKLGQGIFLGYSNKVALGVVFLGPPLLLGFHQVFRLGQLDASLRAAHVTEISLPDLRVGRVRGPGKLRLAGELDWDARLYRSKYNRFYSHDPNRTTEVVGASELLRRQDELLGALVDVRAAEPRAAGFLRSEVQYSVNAIPRDHSGLSADKTARRYAPASGGTPGKLWLASKSADSAPSASGRLVWTLTDDTFARVYGRQAGVPVYGAFLTVIPDLPAAEIADVWVPVKSDSGSVWLVVKPDAGRPQEIVGHFELEGRRHEVDALREIKTLEEPVRVLDAAN